MLGRFKLSVTADELPADAKPTAADVPVLPNVRQAATP